MSKNTKSKSLVNHDAVIDLSEQHVKAETSDAFDQLTNSVKRALAFYASILANVFLLSGLAKEDYEHMRGGTYHGLLSKATHAFFYAGKRNYPSSAYCTYAFGFKYLHTAGRLAEYKATNTVATMIDYHQWLQVMFADAIDPRGEWCGLARNKKETIAKWKTVKADETDKADGKSFKSAVKKSVVVEANAYPVPKVIRDMAQAVAEMSPQKLRIVSIDFDMTKWTQESIEESMQACMAQWTINHNRIEADKARAKAAKAKAKASK